MKNDENMNICKTRVTLRTSLQVSKQFRVDIHESTLWLLLSTKHRTYADDIHRRVSVPKKNVYHRILSIQTHVLETRTSRLEFEYRVYNYANSLAVIYWDPYDVGRNTPKRRIPHAWNCTLMGILLPAFPSSPRCYVVNCIWCLYFRECSLGQKIIAFCFL